LEETIAISYIAKTAFNRKRIKIMRILRYKDIVFYFPLQPDSYALFYQTLGVLNNVRVFLPGWYFFGYFMKFQKASMYCADRPLKGIM